MGKFNLLDEPWIAVLVDKTGEKEEVSMMNFFENASKFRSLAGEMETQNFAVMRFLLSIIQTVFSRFDYNGRVLPGVFLDENWIQKDNVDIDDLDDPDDYSVAVSECWNELFSSKTFSNIVLEYLEKWRDRFYLFDEKYPFFQVNKKEMVAIMSEIPKRNQPTSIFGKNLNRTISESENKEALFSPIAAIKCGRRSRKDTLTEAELARWLLTFQGYSGLADKVALTGAEQRSSKGWLFDIGGIYLQGNNIFETLIMNYIPESPTNNRNFIGRIQRPCWEANGIDHVHRLSEESFIDNLSELYTNWSLAGYIDPGTNMLEPVEIQVVKLPEIEHTEGSIEPMTIWRWNESGPNKNHFTPKKHKAEQSLWRSFGIIAMKTSIDSEKKQKQPGIYKQYQRISKSAGSRWTNMVGVSMEDDGNATSWLPVDEIADNFRINDIVISDHEPNGWIIRITDAIEKTKEVVSGIFGGYLKGICEIRNISKSTGFITEETEKLYETIDRSFREWISSIEPDDSKEERINFWYSQLKKMVLKRGEELFEDSTLRDLTGIEKETGIENIATKYWKFVFSINQKLGKEV